jgi:hypothetical protein
MGDVWFDMNNLQDQQRKVSTIFTMPVDELKGD